MSRLFCVCFAITLALAGAGCFGPQVLEERVMHKPAPDPRLELRVKIEPPSDVLVLYDEQIKSNTVVTRKAFYLFANEGRLVEGKRPDFIKPGYIGKHARVPMFTNAPPDPQAIPGELYAISSSPWSFNLLSRGRLLAECRLPEYGNWFTAKKVFLFPLAAAADAVGVGVAVPAAAAAAAATHPEAWAGALDYYSSK